MGETSSIFRSSTFAGWVSKLNLLGRPGQALHAIVCRSSTCLLQTGNVARTLKNCWEFSSACAITGKLILQEEWSRSSEKKGKVKKKDRERGGNGTGAAAARSGRSWASLKPRGGRVAWGHPGRLGASGRRTPLHVAGIQGLCRVAFPAGRESRRCCPCPAAEQLSLSTTFLHAMGGSREGDARARRHCS